MVYGIVFGGKSFEHEISIVSAINLSTILDIKYFIFLDENSNFYLIDKKDLKSNYFGAKEYKKSPNIYINKGGFYKKGLFGYKKVKIDVIINMVHGGDGEDGKLASLFEFFNIYFIGPRVEASVISYNKYLTKLYADSLGVNIIDYQYFKLDDNININSYPIIIKPTTLGSSIGISIVNNKDELEYALDVAREFSSEVIIEPFIKDINEFNLAGFRIKDKMIFSNIEKVEKDRYLDFDKKYLDFNQKEKVVTNIDNDLEKKLKDSFAKIYNDKFEGSLIRCDFFEKDGIIYLNEINPIPGSMANYLFDNFKNSIDLLSNNLPKTKKISISYKYINQIKGKK